MRVLFVVNRCKKIQMQYVRSIAPRCSESAVIISYIANQYVVDYGLLEPNAAIGSVSVLHPDEIPEDAIDLSRFRREVQSAVARMRPDVVHCLYYWHDALTLVVRDVLDELRHPAVLVYETRDPSGIGRPELPEKEALRAADGYIFATRAIVDDLFARYLWEPQPHIIIRHSELYAHRDGYPPKLSGRDGRAHVALMGTFSEDRDSGRHYAAYIDAFLSSTRNTVLHAFPHLRVSYLEAGASTHGGRLVVHWEDRPYVGNPNPRRRHYTSTIGQLDFTLVAHVLGRPRDEGEILRVCNPTKATSPLVLADLPVLCLPHYRGVVDIIEEYGCGYVYRGWRDLDELLNDRARWPTLIAGAQRAATALCHESQAERVLDFYRRLHGERFGTGAPMPDATSSE
jgi:hypothetical protein